MTHEDDPLASYESADMERQSLIAAAEADDEIVTIALYLNADHRLRRPVSIDFYSDEFDFVELAKRLHLKDEQEVLEAITESWDQLRKELGFGDTT